MKKESEFVEEAPFRNKLQKIFFFGREEVGSEKAWKQFTRSASSWFGEKMLFLKDI